MVQAALTGIGPWTVTWSDGSVSNAAVSPATKVVAPANPNPNAPVTNTYTVTALIDQGATTQCPASPGDLTGSAVIRVNPRPTAIVSGSTNILVDSTNYVTADIRADLTGFGPWTVLWSDGVGQTNVSSPALRTVTNQLTSATNITYTLQNLPNGSSFVTNNIQGALVYPNPPYAGQYYLDIGNKKYFVTATNVTTTPLTSATFTYSVTNLTDLDLNGCTANPGDMIGAAVVTLTAQIGAHVYTFGSTNICAGDVATILADLTGTPPWTVQWSDGTTITNITNSPLNYFVNPSAPGSYSYSITNLTDAVTNAYATNLTGVVLVTVYEVPTNAPVSSGNQTNCVGVANPALVIPGTNSIIWYDSNTNVVALNTNSFVPGDTAPGNWLYYAAEINSNGCVGPFTAVNLVLLACTNPPAIQWNGTNGTVAWFGNLTLLSSTNLSPPVTWTVLSNGVMQTNIWNWTNTTPPIQFFRLTNSP